MIDKQPDFQMLTTENGPDFFIQLLLFWMLIAGFWRPYHLLCCGLKDCFLIYVSN